MGPRIGQTRREFLHGGAIALAASALASPAIWARRSAERRCILLWLTGGPSHIDTFDPKPVAPVDYRGPFRPIATKVPGLHVSELLPRLAARADRVAFIRSMHHHEAPIHETGQQLLQTGHVFRGSHDYPHFGAVMSANRIGRWAVIPGPLGDTGVDVSHGQTAGYLGPQHAPLFKSDTRPADEQYGDHSFGRQCSHAVRLIESGYRLAVVNMFSTVYDTVSWDCHADGGRLRTDLNDYRDTVAPRFDQAFAALLDDLSDLGLLSTTLVVAAGEFGRTPRINPRGGRDHWPGVWTVLMAGAGIRGGAVIGASDKIGAEPTDRPVTPPEFVATIFHALGAHIPPHMAAEPVLELFG